MNDRPDLVPPGDDDPVLTGAGERLRQGSASISPAAVEVAVLRRRSRRAVAVAGAALLVVAVLAGALVAQRGSDSPDDVAIDRPGAPSRSQVDRLLASLDDRPVNPTKVKLVSTVSTFADCGALIGDLRKVGAQHVGSRGFGASGYDPYGFSAVNGPLASIDNERLSLPATGAASDAGVAGGGGGTTLGTNVQVEGVDELDSVKAVGSLVYDLDGKGNLRITDSATLGVLSTLDVTPGRKDPVGGGTPGSQRQGISALDLLVAKGKVVVFGRETDVSKPVAGDPSASQASTPFLTVTFVDAADPKAPKVTDRVRVEGSLVSARLVEGEVRLVTTSNMADLGFVLPTTPNSVVPALEMNRRTVASSTPPDWIPDWQRAGEDARPLVPCERVHVPDTFSGVAMTSMVTFPLGTGRFDPAGTSILAPADTLYAGLEKVAISSGVWVDPADRDRLEFDDWQTAIHEFTFAGDDAPTYEGSGIVDGSTVGQFAFGEVGDALAVVTAKGTPWRQNPSAGVDLTLLTPDGEGGLGRTATVADLANGKGEVSAVRFVDGRVLISTGPFGRQLDVIDVSDPAKPRRAGRTDLSTTVGYFHPLPDQRALVVGQRSDELGEGQNRLYRSWVQAQLLDVSDADAPKVVATWERPWSSDAVAYDHHAFTYWPDRKLAMWGIQNTAANSQVAGNNALVLSVGDDVRDVAVPPANKPAEVAPPCPTVPLSDEVQEMVGDDAVVLSCGDEDRGEVDWPRYRCYLVDDATVERFAGGDAKGAFFSCSPAGPPTVRRVLVVSGRPILLTDQTLEALDPTSFASTAIAYHPSTEQYVTY